MRRSVRLSVVVALVVAAAVTPALPSTAAIGAWDTPTNLSEVDNPASAVRLATNDVSVTAVWRAWDGANYRIQTATSPDGGATWAAPITLSEAGESADAPQVTFWDTTVTAVWNRVEGGIDRIQTSTSTDSGQTWGAPVTISALGASAAQPQITTDGTTITAVWRRYDGPVSLIQTVRSTDAGATWSAPVTLSTAGANARAAQIVTDGITTTVIWARDDGSDFRLQSVSSTDSGATWSAPVTISDAGGSVEEPQFVTDGSTMTAVWSQFDGSYTRTQTSSSVDDGATWSAPVTLSGGGADAYNAQVATDGTTIIAAWIRSPGTGTHIQVATSTDAGATWSAPATISDTAQSAGSPHLVSEGGEVTAVWERFDGSNGRIQASTSTDAGVTWSTPDTLSVAGQTANAPKVVAAGSTLVVAWFRHDGTSDRIQASSYTAEMLVTRLSGADRYATSVEISSEFDPDVPVVYIATGTNYPDALSAASAAAFQGGPLLLTSPSSLPTVVRDELLRLNPDLVVIAGGTGSVSAGVETAVRALLPGATVRRDAGPNRYATSRVIAENAFPAGTTTDAFIATGRNFPDALSASAAAGAAGMPVILVDGNGTGIDTGTQALFTTLGLQRVSIAGGTGVVNSAVEGSLSALLGSLNVERFGGANRFATSVAINDGSFTTATTVFLANGTNFPDALSGAALAGNLGAPLFVVPRTCVPPAVLAQISDLGARKVVLLGGTGVLTQSVFSLTSC